MPYGNINVDTVTTSTSGGILGAGNASIMKNRIINGAMVIDQRNAGASVTRTSSTSGYSLDRWNISNLTGGTYTAQQSTDVPTNAGFSYSLKATVTVADTSITTTENAAFFQPIEGYNIADLRFGYSNASSVTLSFWVKSTVTGTFSCCLTNSDNSRANPQSFTINSSNTWEQKTITFAGDTSGTWLTTNGIGLFVYVWLATGPTYQGSAGWNGSSIYAITGQANAMSTIGNVFAITGVQLEVGSSATGFEYVNYQTSLANCQRYYEKSYAIGTAPATATTTSRITSSGNQGSATTGYVETSIQWKVNKRGTPTVTIYDMAGNSGKCTRLSTGVGTSDNQTVATSVEGETSSSVFSSGTYSANCLQYHYTASAEL
jgi:hypothetical protein